MCTGEVVLAQDKNPDLSPLMQLWCSVAEVSPKSGRPELVCLDSAQKLAAELGAEICAGSDLLVAVAEYLAETGRVMSPLLRIRLAFAERWFQAFLELLQVEYEIAELLQQLRPHFYRRALCDDRLFENASGEYVRLLQCLSVELPTWYPRQGRAAERYLTNLQALIEQLDSADDLGASAAIEAYLQAAAKERARAQTQTQRTVERELAELKVTEAKSLVAEQYLAHLVGADLPQVASPFITQQLLGELQFVLINHGEQAPLWKLWKRLAQLLPAIASCNDKQQLYAQVQAIMNLLESSQDVYTLAQTQYDDFVAALSEALFAVLRGESIEMTQVEPVGDSVARIDAETQVSRSLLKQVAQVREGDWFLLETESGEVVRAQLAKKMIEVKRLLFVNRTGHKVAFMSVDEFALCLSSRVAVALKVEPLFEACSVRAVNYLREIYDANLHRHRQERAEQQRLEAAQREQQAREREAKRAAAEKARREAELLAEQERERQLELERMRQQALADERERQHLEVVQLVDGLKIGSWLELPLKGEEALRVKLAVSMRSTGKHIFVDRIGVKQGELLRDELIALIESGRGKVLAEGDSFDSQLSKVVMGLRKDVGG